MRLRSHYGDQRPSAWMITQAPGGVNVPPSAEPAQAIHVRISDHRARQKAPGELGKPRHIVSPLVVEVVIQKDRWKQAKIERGTRSEPLDDLPGGEIFFV
jgi:hypothetical protein